MQNKTLNWVKALRPKDWSQYTLADVCSFTPYSNVKDKGDSLTGAEPVYLQTKKTRYYFPAHLEKYVLKDADLYAQADRDDVVICLDGFVTDEGDSVLGRTLTGYSGVLGTGMYKVVIKDAFTPYADYIKQAIRSPYIRQQIITMARGAIVKHAGYTVTSTIIYVPDNLADMRKICDTLSVIELFGSSYIADLNKKVQKKSDTRKKLQIELCNSVGELFMESLWQMAVLDPNYIFNESKYSTLDI